MIPPVHPTLRPIHLYYHPYPIVSGPDLINFLSKHFDVPRPNGDVKFSLLRGGVEYIVVLLDPKVWTICSKPEKHKSITFNAQVLCQDAQEACTTFLYYVLAEGDLSVMQQMLYWLSSDAPKACITSFRVSREEGHGDNNTKSSYPCRVVSSA